MKKLLVLSLAMFLILSGCGRNQGNNELPENPNFLIFFIDDLRPELGCYGQDAIHSPNIDAIAEAGLRFERAYCNVPVCGASRASLLTGIRPTPQRFVYYYTRADEDVPGHISLPKYFKDNGYYTLSYGKIFHHGDDSQESWSEPAWHAKPKFSGTWRDYILDENIQTLKNKEGGGPSREIARGASDTAYIDGKTAEKVIGKLGELSKKDQPFMVWVGFVKPHLPFNAPAKYYDMYDPEEINLASNPDRPENSPNEALHNFGELRGYDDIPAEGPLSDEKSRELIHGYYACVSYTDALIGKVMNELERLNLEENTIVAVFGDHGWNLGEHGLWCKHCNFNTSLQVPLIIKVPGKSAGKTTQGLVEFVDLYPTFASLANLDVPIWTDGKNLEPLINDPKMKWDDPVYPRYVKGNSIVTTNHIYTEFMSSRQDCTIVSNMLYDHRLDPDENFNISNDKQNEDLVDSLSTIMNRIHLSK